MRLGVGRLLLAIASVVARMGGEHNTADLLAYAYLATVTFHLCHWRDLRDAGTYRSLLDVLLPLSDRAFVGRQRSYWPNVHRPATVTLRSIRHRRPTGARMWKA